MTFFNTIHRDILSVVERLPLNNTEQRQLIDKALEAVIKLSKERSLSDFPVRDIVIAAIYLASRRTGISITPLDIKEAYDDKAVWNNSWTKVLELMRKHW